MRAVSSTRVGTLSAFMAFFVWGLLPVYWKWLGGVPAAEILAHRIVWATVVMAVVVPIFRRDALRSALRDRRALVAACVAGLLVGINWFLYVWSVGIERIVEASLGYYINPLVSVVLGVVVLRERLTRVQVAALLLAAAGVVVLTVGHGRLPWISLTLAVTFGTYGLVKKIGRLDSMTGLLVELVLLAPLATVYLVTRHAAGEGAFGTGDAVTTWLLAGAGVVTTLPLLLFGSGARRIPLSRLGFLQYLAPTMMLAIATLVYGEPFSAAHAASFACIWIALMIYGVTLARPRATMA